MLERWAASLAGVSGAIASATGGAFRALGRPGRLLQDFLNGSWLGHPLHPVLTDVVVGAATVAVMLDVLRIVFRVPGLELATTWTVALTVLSALGTIVTGLTDFKDTAPGSSSRNVAGLHGLINIGGTALFAVALVLRLLDHNNWAALIFVVGYGVVSVGAFIGGHVVFKYGEMVNHNAFARGKRAKEFTAVLPVAELAEATPTKTMLGATALVLVRRGDVVHALKESCSHAGGPLSQGTLVDGAIQCPWHQSVFRLRDGAVLHGPATSRQVMYRARVTDGQVEVQGPFD
ncbi:MAG TPA: Rieske (2Fe-2S) protein [Candidatus Limnocylindria bacterium]|nr:Rieske (2Fe-2S) protein [Candidatus Limnocylindria bacterium]